MLRNFKRLITMFDMSLSVANFISGLANIALLVGAVLVAIGTAAAIWSGGVRDRFADERISTNESKTTAAIADAARANEATEKLRESNLTLQARADHERSERLKLELKIAPRHLSALQREMLIDALKPFHGQKIYIECIMGDSEGEQYAKEFEEVFRSAGWDNLGATEITQSVIIPTPIGIEVTLNQSEVMAGRQPKSAQALLDTLMANGIIKKKIQFMNPQSPTDRITFRVGKKPD